MHVLKGQSLLPVAAYQRTFTSSSGDGAKDGKLLDSLQKLANRSPTGRLLDLFLPEHHSQSTSKAGPRQKTAAETPSVVAEEHALSESDALEVILKAVENCKPLVKVQSINTGARVIHVPKPVMPNEQESMSVRSVY